MGYTTIYYSFINKKFFLLPLTIGGFYGMINHVDKDEEKEL